MLRIIRGLLIFVLIILFGSSAGTANSGRVEGVPRGLSMGPELIKGLPNPAPEVLEKQSEGLKTVQDGFPAPAAPGAVTQAYPASVIVYASLRNMDNFDIYRVNDDGTGLVRIDGEPSDDVQPRVNYAVNRVAFVSDRTGQPDIFAINLDGTSLRKLTSNTVSNQMPAWSPDGSKIAFQSYRDGQWEVYVMNADGHDPIRLTYTPPGGFSGEPTWSPDGSKIAYTSFQNGGWRIWVMNADGSGQTQLSTKPYSSRPAWSPDGSTIAFNCDDPDIPGTEIFKISPDGSFERYSNNTGSIYRDQFVAGWSPDSRHVIYTEVNYILIDTTWYWTTADTKSSTISLIGNLNDHVDWDADWRTTDHVKPVVTVDPLPAVSPWQVPYTYQASDNGGSGIRRVTLQMRDGANGIWENLPPYTGQFIIGQGGHTYYLRAQAEDYGGNYSDWSDPNAVFTTIENLPPVTTVQALPVYSPVDFTVQYSAVDPGGSGIEQYTIEVNLGLDPFWHIIQYPKVTLKDGIYSLNYSGQPGITYSFRVRANDLANNLEQFGPQHVVTTTTYLYKLSGKVTDHTSRPLEGVSIQSMPGPFVGGSSTADGTFLSLIKDSGIVTANWVKAGYGSPPETVYSYTNYGSAEQMVVLPPADNAIVNPGLEFTTSLAAPWSGQGIVPPFITTTHLTGASAIQLGPDSQFNLEPFSDKTYSGQLKVDGLGVTHLAWIENPASPLLYYSQKAPGGNWIPAQPVPGVTGPLTSFNLKSAAGPDGSFYLTWVTQSGMFRSRRAPNGTWTIPYQIQPITGIFATSDFLFDSAGAGQFIWEESDHSLYYTRILPDGTWLPKETVTHYPEVFVGANSLIVDAAGEAQVVYTDINTGQMMVRRRSLAGGWASAEVLTNWTQACFENSSTPHQAADNAGGIFVTFTGELCSPTPVMLLYRSAAGVWSTAEDVPVKGSQAWVEGLEVGPDGALHILFNHNYQFAPSGHTADVSYIRRTPEGVWLQPVVLNDTANLSSGFQLLVDAQSTAHILWNETGNNQVQRVFYARMAAATDFIGKILEEISPDVPMISSAAFDQNGQLLFVTRFNDPPQGSGAMYIGRSWMPAVDGVTSLAQTVVVPAEMQHPILSFVYQLKNAMAANNGRINVLASANGITETLFTSTANTAGWTHQWVDLAGYAGQEVKISFQSVVKENTIEAFVLLDDVTLGTSPADVWVDSPLAIAMPGRETRYTLRYGNQGYEDAANVTITHTLPAEVQFVSASLAVTPTLVMSGTRQLLRWDLPLAAGQSSGEIYITVTVPAGLNLGLNLAGDLEIRTQSGEAEMVNNFSQTRLYIGNKVFLPVVQKR